MAWVWALGGNVDGLPVISAHVNAALPGSPRGIVKLRIAAADVPEFETVAAVPEAPVVVVPILTVAARPGAPAMTSMGIDRADCWTTWMTMSVGMLDQGRVTSLTISRMNVIKVDLGQVVEDTSISPT